MFGSTVAGRVEDGVGEDGGDKVGVTVGRMGGVKIQADRDDRIRPIQVVREKVRFIGKSSFLLIRRYPFNFVP